MVIAAWLMNVLISFKPPVPVPIALDLRLDTSVLLFTLGLSIVTGILFGLAPAWHASRTDIVPVLKDETLGRATAVASSQRLRRRAGGVFDVPARRRRFVRAQPAERASDRRRIRSHGHDRDGGVPELQGFDETRGRNLYERLLTGVAAVPGVRSATLAQSVPLGIGGSRRGTSIEGYQPQPGEDTETAYNVVAPQYFETMRIPLLRGRAFTEADRAGAPPVVIVNDAFTRRYWPNADPIGKRISAHGSEGPFREVIGVTRTGKYNTLGEDPRPFYYLPLWQEYQRNRDAARQDVRRLSRADLAGSRRRTRRRFNSAGVRHQDDGGADAGGAAAGRLAGTLLGAFGLLALLLASVGIYGVMAYSVVQRTREIGVRRALGAQTGNLLRLVLGEGMRLAAIGFAIGLAAAVALTRFAASLLYGVTPTDPLTFVTALGLLSGAAFVACYIPALRALRIDALTALRYE